jgi:hypothetical protein
MSGCESVGVLAQALLRQLVVILLKNAMDRCRGYARYSADDLDFVDRR